MSKVIVIGGGAAGMMAAIFAARNNNKVIIYEKNEKLGKKLYITGKGRCNLTNACDIEEIFDNIMTNSKFMYSAIYSFTNQDCINFFESIGLKTKIERGNRVFPKSDKSSDVINVLSKELLRLDVKIELNSDVQDIIMENGIFKSIKVNNKIINGDKLIITTGGLSYPSTGSSGDGYKFAKMIGHNITKLYPSLVPFNIKDDLKSLQGLSLKNVKLTIKVGKKDIFSDFGEMLFTHFGISGPLILSASSYIIPYLNKKDEINIYIDLKPALSFEQLDNRILRDFESFINKQFKNSLDLLLPKKIIPIIIEKTGINPDKKVNFITKDERYILTNTIKNFSMTFDSLRGYNEAVITKGGVTIKEINPSTMQSKKVDNIFFAGEVIDVDALTGGFNLQIAWSTAYLAGNNV